MAWVVFCHSCNLRKESPGLVWRPLVKALKDIMELPAGLIWVIFNAFCPHITFRLLSIVPGEIFSGLVEGIISAAAKVTCSVLPVFFER